MLVICSYPIPIIWSSKNIFYYRKDLFAFVDVIFSLQMSKFCQVYLVLSVICYIRKHNQVIYILKISKFYLSLLLVFYLMHPSSVLCAKLLQSCPTFCDTMDCSLPASSVHGTLQARILKWVAMPFSKKIFLTPGLNLCLLSLWYWLLAYLPLTFKNPTKKKKKNQQKCI